jgi:hypothetical protein
MSGWELLGGETRIDVSGLKPRGRPDPARSRGRGGADPGEGGRAICGVAVGETSLKVVSSDHLKARERLR